MTRYGLLIPIALAACTPNYESGKTQCSDKKECPDGFSCRDDGTNAIHYCVENKLLGCSDKSAFYCLPSRTCSEKVVACSAVDGGGAGVGDAAAKGGSGGGAGVGGATARGGSGGSGSGGTGGSSTGPCSGTSFSCASMYNSYDCSLSVGCTWSTATASCTGTPAACSVYASSGALCDYNGCTWSGGRSCTATTVTSFCQSTAAATTDACGFCLYNSCCASATACYNDNACSADTPNATFFAVYTCAFNCCASACL